MLDIIRRNSQSWAVKAIFAAIIIVFVFWGASAMNTPSTQTLASVNGEPIYFNEFARAYEKVLRAYQRNPEARTLDQNGQERLGQQVLRDMITILVLKQEALRLGLYTSDAELSRYVSGMPQFQESDGKFDPKLYNLFLSSNKLTAGVYERDLSENLLLDKLRGYVYASRQVSSGEIRQAYDFMMEERVFEYLLFPVERYLDAISPDDAAIGNYYSANAFKFAEPARAELEYALFDVPVLASGKVFSDAELERYYEDRQAGFTIPEQYRSSHILVQVPFGAEADEVSVKKAEARIREAEAALKSGRSFAEAAREYSDDSMTREKGGELGWMEKGRIEPAYEAAVLDLKPGEVSAPVRTYYGFHLIRLEEVRPGGLKPFAEVKTEILETMTEDEAFRAMGKIAVAVEDAIISKEDLPAIAGRYNAQIGSTGLTSVDSLPDLLKVKPEQLDGISKTAIGSLLPYIVDLPQGFMVIKVKEYQPAHTRPLDAVTLEIAAFLKDEGARKLALAEAEKVADEIAGAGGVLPVKYASMLKNSLPANRVAGIVDFGLAPAMDVAAFALEPGKWTVDAFSADAGAVLLKLKSVAPVSEEQWDSVSAGDFSSFKQAKQEELFGLYLSAAGKNARIEVFNVNPLRRQQQ